MKFARYNRGNGKYTIGSVASIAASNSENSTSSTAPILDVNCYVYGNEFDGTKDIEETAFVNGSVYAYPKLYEPYDEENEDDEEDDNSGKEEKEFEKFEGDEGGDIYAQNLIRGDKVYGKTIFLDYPKKIETIDPLEIDETNKMDLLEVLKRLMPIGSIIMHNGNIDRATLLEYGWAVCDGSNGTPNLVDRFVKGGTTAGTTGGSKTHTLTVAELPSHSHTYNAPNGTSSAGSHSHSVSASSTSVAQGEGSTAYPIGSVSDTSTNGSHSHSVYTSSSNTSSVGNATPFNIEPQYYTLIYVMRLW